MSMADIVYTNTGRTLLEELATHDWSEYTSTEIAAKLEVTPRQVYNAVYRLKKQGIFVRRRTVDQMNHSKKKELPKGTMEHEEAGDDYHHQMKVQKMHGAEHISVSADGSEMWVTVHGKCHSCFWFAQRSCNYNMMHYRPGADEQVKHGLIDPVKGGCDCWRNTKGKAVKSYVPLPEPR